MAFLTTSALKGRRPRPAGFTRPSGGLRSEERTPLWPAPAGPETSASCPVLIERNPTIAKGVDSYYVPAGGSS
jgi:hypothetical protein